MDLQVGKSNVSEPCVSVLLCVYNGERFLEVSVRSMMAQTLREIEIVVVDDCSTDSTSAILSKLAKEDARIRILRTPRNLKLAGALNFGLKHVRAPLVARMDDDDISLPERLAIQKHFLDTHPSVTLVGASIEWISDKGKLIKRSIRGRDSTAVRWQSRFGIHVPHPTFMFRTKLPDGTPLQYDAEVLLAEDLEFLNKLILANAEVVCLPDVLLRYRFHGASVSRKYSQLQRDVARQLTYDFHARTLSPDISARLEPLRHCFFDVLAVNSPDWAAGFQAAREMLANDVQRHPTRAAWYRRQTAHLMFQCMQRSGLSRGAMVRLFLLHGRDMISSIVFRVLEAKEILPKALRSDPDVWAKQKIEVDQASPKG